MSTLSSSVGIGTVTFIFFVGVYAQKPSSGEAYLMAHGITNVKEVIYYERVDNASGCLSQEDADSVLFQLCDARSVIEECVSKDETILYDSCKGRQCTGKFSKAHTRCLLEKSGLDSLGDSEFALCSPPAKETGFFDWQTQAWALEAERRNVFECIVAAPPETRMEYRLVCKGDDPILQHRIRFHSSKFLKNKKGAVQCLGIHKCSGPKIFHAELACYVIDPNNNSSKRFPDAKASSKGGIQDKKGPTEDVKEDVKSGDTADSDSDGDASGGTSEDEMDVEDLEVASSGDALRVQNGDEGSASSIVFSLSSLGVAIVLMVVV